MDTALIISNWEYSSPDPCLEPIHIASVLSIFTFKPEHCEKRDSTCNEFSNDWGLSSKIKNESSAYWLRRNSEFSICTIFDLYRVNLKNDPRCVCGHLFEDAIHFFLECPLYQHDRTSMFNNFTLSGKEFHNFIVEGKKDLELVCRRHLWVR
jgi:hypothetical protein